MSDERGGPPQSPPGLATCSDLTAQVNGEPIWVEHLEKSIPEDSPAWFKQDAPKKQEVNLVTLACTNPCKVAIHLKEPGKALTVRPKHRRIAVTGKGQDWTLELPGPCQLYVEIGSLPPLLIFAEPPESKTSLDDPETRIFGPGVHTPGLITLKDDDQVYLAPGAVVYGGLRGSPRQARVFGRGTLDGSQLDDRMVRLDRASHVLFEGITMRCGKGWQNTLQNCDDVTYRHVKILSFGACGDGIDPVCSRNIRIEGCFFRCSDDCIAVKGMKGGPKVSGIAVQDCVMVGYIFSDGFTVGMEADTTSMEGITVRNCDILQAQGLNAVGQHSAFSIICDGPAVIRDVTFEDIRVEENVPQMFELNVTDGTHYTKAPPGHIRNVRLKNIHWETAKPLLIRGHDKDHLVEDVVFEGCSVAGAPLSPAQVQTNDFAKRIVVR